jgi:hypothetical protein
MNYTRAGFKKIDAHWKKMKTAFPEHVLTIRCEKANEANENCRMGGRDYDVTDHMAETTKRLGTHVFVMRCRRRHQPQSTQPTTSTPTTTLPTSPTTLPTSQS